MYIQFETFIGKFYLKGLDWWTLYLQVYSFKDLIFITLIKIKLLILDNYWNLVTIPGGWLVVG